MRFLKENFKISSGITLVSLAITIIIIIILATVTINMAFGDNGLITQAQLAKGMTTNSVLEEQEKMNKLMNQYTNVMEEDKELPLPPYVDSVLPTAPEISKGMTPVKWNGSNWVKTTVSDSEWYNYKKKEWANVVLGDSTFNEDGILNEDLPYSMLVWIPRYAYQITNGYHQSGAEINPDRAGTIEIVFIDLNNQNKEKTKTYNETYPESNTGTGMTDYVVHPAFNYGGTKLSGFWVGKFETSHTNCTSDVTTGQADYTGNEVIQIKAGVTSWRNIKVSDIFTVCINMNANSDNPYGLNTNDSIVDPHLMKNSEWGAVAYLSQSKIYGKESEVWMNPNINYITGESGDSANVKGTTNTNEYFTLNGQQASTNRKCNWCI